MNTLEIVYVHSFFSLSLALSLSFDLSLSPALSRSFVRGSSFAISHPHSLLVFGTGFAGTAGCLLWGRKGERDRKGMLERVSNTVPPLPLGSLSPPTEPHPDRSPTHWAAGDVDFH